MKFRVFIMINFFEDKLIKIYKDHLFFLLKSYYKF